MWQWPGQRAFRIQGFFPGHHLIEFFSKFILDAPGFLAPLGGIERLAGTVSWGKMS